MITHTIIATPLGPLWLRAEHDHLTGAYFEGQRYFPASLYMGAKSETSGVLRQASAQLHDFFAGARQTFALALRADGTGFQASVWRAIAEIPFGETRTYGEIARRCGRPTAVRAVGLATGRNPLGVIVPCHRVIGAQGALTGYAGGLARKAWLLNQEADRTFGVNERAFARAA